MSRLLLLFLFTSVTLAEEVVLLEIPPCGIASAYGMFVNLGLEVSLNDVTLRCQDFFPEDDPRQMPISHLQTLIQSFGLHTLAVKSDLATLDSSYLPAILCIINTPSGSPLPVGHVVLLRDIQGNTAVFTDYQVGVETRSAPLAQLQTISGGNMILVSKKPISLPFPWVLVALWLTVFTSVLGLAYVAYSWWQSGQKTKRPPFHAVEKALMLLAVLLSAGGCGKKSSIPDIELKTSETVAEATMFHVDTPSKPKAINPFKYVFPERSPTDSLLLFEKHVQDPGEPFETNGCTGVPDKGLGFNFTASCNKHDECYETCGADKTECDKQFYEDMKNSCSGQLSHIKNRCLFTAWLYYKTVLNAPSSWFYEPCQKRWCVPQLVDCCTGNPVN